jgi:hypothetical protein
LVVVENQPLSTNYKFVIFRNAAHAADKESSTLWGNSLDYC